jgi:hypothetical protein
VTRIRSSFPLLCLLLLLTTAVLAQAEGTVVVEVNEHQVRFGESLQFHLAASSSADINSVVLTYRTADNQGMTVERLSFSPAPHVEAVHEIDLARHPLKPFVKVEYWWTVSDAAGQQITTEHQQFFYEDNRFAWQSLPGQHAVVHWYNGDVVFGSLALDVADQAVNRIREQIDPPLALSEPFHFYLYASETDLLPALPATGQEWVIGQAYPELRLAVAAVPAGPESASTVRWLIPHELTHLLLYEATGSSYGRLPPWLNEGLAVVNEQVPDPDDALVLDQALQNDQLFSLDALCYSFPRQGDRVRLAYAQSASVVRFVQENYGRSAIGQLVAAYRDDLSCGGGVRRALGISLSNLESQWRESLGARPKIATFLKQAAPWLLLILAGIPLLVLVAYPLAAHRAEERRERLM